MKLRFAIVACLLALCLPCFALAEGAALAFSSFSVEKGTDSLTLQSSIRLDNPTLVRNQLRDGAHMVLKGVATLHRVRTILSNPLAGEGQVEIHLRHDPLRRDFLAFRGKNVYQNRNFGQLIEAAWDAAPLDISLTEPLVPGESYRLSVSLTLQHSEVPPWLEKALFFWSWDVVPPIEVTQDFQF